jgi:antitoxin component YwqK of YwqJK toxin-antitoxin module
VAILTPDIPDKSSLKVPAPIRWLVLIGIVVFTVWGVQSLIKTHFFQKHETIETKYPNGQIKGRYLVLAETARIYVKDGQYESWYDNGIMSYEGNYRDGNMIGEWKGWYKGGMKSFEENYVDGERNGRCTYYDEDGKIQRDILYKGGRIVKLFQ